ncbi:MAG: rod shape-determining protein MreD [Thermodesulfobacteriota bacterium]
MKSFPLYLLLVIIYLSVRSTLLANLPAPDLSLVVVFYIALQKASFEGAIFSFILGYIDDVFSGGVIGMTSLSLVAVFMATHYLSRRVDMDTPYTRILGVTLMALLKGVISCLVIYSMNEDIPSLLPILLTLVVTGLLAPLLLNLIAKIDGLIVERGSEGRVA